VRDYAEVRRAETVNARFADEVLQSLEVDGAGLDALDRRYLRLIAEAFTGGPVGIETLAAALAEARDNIEETIEPYLIQQGFLQRTPRGRVLTLNAYGHLGINAPARDPAQAALFDMPKQGDGDV